MSGLNDNHKRRILTSLQYADKLLQENLHALAPGAQPVFGGYVQDLSPSQRSLVEGYTRKIREQMCRLLIKCGVELPKPSTFVSGKLRTGVTSLDLTLEDIYPEKMRGYGKMDAAAARDLSQTLQEMRRMVSQLLTLLYESKEPPQKILPQLESEPALAELIRRMTQIIAEYGLVEFLPALKAMMRHQELPLETVAHQAEALRAALLATLERIARGPRPADGFAHAIEPPLRQLDEALLAFQRKYERRFEEIATWKHEVLELAAAELAHASGEKDLSPAFIVEATIRAVISCGVSFSEEYRQVTGGIGSILEELKKNDTTGSMVAQDLPKLTATPLPIASGLHGAKIAPPEPRSRSSLSARTRHYRTELQDKLGAQLEQLLEELQPRLQHWLMNALRGLEDSVRLQTDPLRYGSQAGSTPGTMEKWQADIAFLKLKRG
jgi:hypothetical protein